MCKSQYVLYAVFQNDMRNASPRSLFLWTFTELHDYFKDRDVRNAHVLLINNGGDFAVSFFEEG